jgi:hypothetical protein
MSTDSIPWKKLVTEGIVIVVSILLAFAIDAWWDDRQELRAAKDQVSRVLAELRANVGILENQEQYLGYAIEGAKELLARFGPEPLPTEVAEIAAFINRIFAVPTMSLERAASVEFLSTGQLTEGAWFDIRIRLADILSVVQAAENASIELRQMRPGIISREAEFVSGLDLSLGHELMADYQPSRFPSDTHALLSDRRYENVIANYAIRMEINRQNVRGLIERYASLVADLEAQL